MAVLHLLCLIFMLQRNNRKVVYRVLQVPVLARGQLGNLLVEDRKVLERDIPKEQAVCTDIQSAAHPDDSEICGKS